jgi:hypothetical protein
VTLSSKFAHLTLQLRENPRLRYGVWVLAALFLGYLALGVQEWQQGIVVDHDSRLERLMHLETLAGSSMWLDRVKTSRALSIQLESRLWRANSKGLAQAKVQNWVNTQMKKAALDKAKIKVDTARPVDGVGSVWEIAVEIEGLFPLDACLDFLAAVEKESSAAVETLTLIRGRPSRCTLGVKCYVRAGAS